MAFVYQQSHVTNLLTRGHPISVECLGIDIFIVSTVAFILRCHLKYEEVLK